MRLTSHLFGAATLSLSEQKPMTCNSDRFIVLTGGPGSGKTTLIDHLRRLGHANSVEAGRGVIQDQTAIRGPALPWKDRALFAELMLSWEMRSHHLAASLSGRVFFDRGVPDVIGYLHLCGLPVSEHVHEAARRFRYNARVLIAPPWREIYRGDAERRQDFAEAERTFESMIQAYSATGYQLLLLPKGPVEERIQFIIEQYGLAADSQNFRGQA